MGPIKAVQVGAFLVCFFLSWFVLLLFGFF